MHQTVKVSRQRKLEILESLRLESNDTNYGHGITNVASSATIHMTDQQLLQQAKGLVSDRAKRWILSSGIVETYRMWLDPKYAPNEANFEYAKDYKSGILYHRAHGMILPEEQHNHTFHDLPEEDKMPIIKQFLDGKLEMRELPSRIVLQSWVLSHEFMYNYTSDLYERMMNHIKDAEIVCMCNVTHEQWLESLNSHIGAPGDAYKYKESSFRNMLKNHLVCLNSFVNFTGNIRHRTSVEKCNSIYDYLPDDFRKKLLCTREPEGTEPKMLVTEQLFLAMYITGGTLIPKIVEQLSHLIQRMIYYHISNMQLREWLLSELTKAEVELRTRLSKFITKQVFRDTTDLMLINNNYDSLLDCTNPMTMHSAKYKHTGCALENPTQLFPPNESYIRIKFNPTESCDKDINGDVLNPEGYEIIELEQMAIVYLLRNDYLETWLNEVDVSLVIPE